jgi:hypothetical protein
LNGRSQRRIEMPIQDEPDPTEDRIKLKLLIRAFLLVLQMVLI